MLGLLRSLAKRSGFAGIEPFSPHATGSSGEKLLRWVFLHDDAALETLLKSGPDVWKVSTFNVFQLRGPVRNPPQNRLGVWSLIGLLLTRRIMVVTFGTPLSVPQLSVPRLQRLLKLDFYRNLKIVRGAPLQSVEAQANAIMAGSEFEKELRILADRSGEPLARMRNKARAAYFELAANPKRPFYSVLAFISRVIVARLFTQVVTKGVERLTQAIKDHPVVLVPMHRSHLDYILVQYKLWDSNVNPPLIAAGINLSFWPIGFLTRSVGAYFVKRNARDRLHLLMLRRYVLYLIKRGHAQNFFIEGGRSRSGKMLQPKVGLLSVIVDAFLKGLRKDILFVPVSISYESVIEDSDFGEENTGRSKKKENLVSLLRAADIFHKKYGEVIVDFGNPLSLSAFFAQRNHSKNGNGKPNKQEDKQTVQELGYFIIRSIRNQINPSLTNLAYTALMAAPNYGLTRTDLVNTIHEYARYLALLRQVQGGLGDFTSSLERFLDGKVSIIDDLARGGVVRIERCLDNEVFFIPGGKRFTADFYRNSVFHLFFPLGVLSLLASLRQPLTESSIEGLYEIFSYDLMLAPRGVFFSELNQIASLLQAHGTLLPVQDKVTFTGKHPGLSSPLTVLSGIQSLLWVEYSLIYNKTAQIAPDSDDSDVLKVFSYGKFLEALQTEFHSARYLGLVSRTEASARSSLSGALDSLQTRQIVSIEDKAGQKGKLYLKKDCRLELERLSRLNAACLESAYQETLRETSSSPTAVALP